VQHNHNPTTTHRRHLKTITIPVATVILACDTLSTTTTANTPPPAFSFKHLHSRHPLLRDPSSAFQTTISTTSCLFFSW
jgi:cytosine/uracil/thiamine/allantoin permease